MKKNSQLHLFLESEILDSLKKEADNENLSVSELCRNKIRKNSQLTRIEFKIDILIEKIKKIENER